MRKSTGNSKNEEFGAFEKLFSSYDKYFLKISFSIDDSNYCLAKNFVGRFFW